MCPQSKPRTAPGRLLVKAAEIDGLPHQLAGFSVASVSSIDLADCAFGPKGLKISSKVAKSW